MADPITVSVLLPTIISFGSKLFGSRGSARKRAEREFHERFARELALPPAEREAIQAARRAIVAEERSRRRINEPPDPRLRPQVAPSIPPTPPETPAPGEPSPTPTPDPRPDPPIPPPHVPPVGPATPIEQLGRVFPVLPNFVIPALTGARPLVPVMSFLPPAVVIAAEGVALRKGLIGLGRILLGAFGLGSLLPPFGPGDDEEERVTEIPPIFVPRRILRPKPEIQFPEISPIEVRPTRRLPEIRPIEVEPRRRVAPVTVPGTTPAQVPGQVPSVPSRPPPARSFPRIGQILIATGSGLVGAVASQALTRPGVGTITTTIPREVPAPGLPDPTPGVRPGAPPRTDIPVVPGQTQLPDPVIQPFAQPLAQQVRARTREKDCVEVKTKRIRARCFEGFYAERFRKTQFTPWREVDCFAGRTIPKPARGLI